MTELASPDPVPGAGPAVSHVGAVAASLVTMVAGNNLKAGAGSIDSEDLEATRQESRLLAEELSDLVGEDSDVYFQVMAALDLPRDTERDKKARARALGESMRMATEIPLQIMARCLATYRLARRLALEGSKMAAADALAAAELACASVYGGGAMVRANLSHIRDKEYARYALGEAERIEGEVDIGGLRLEVGRRVVPQEENN
ncbi:MAG: cyclodeaminase/cyclohydrolase family protein [Bacillota bacterium]